MTDSLPDESRIPIAVERWCHRPANRWIATPHIRLAIDEIVRAFRTEAREQALDDEVLGAMPPDALQKLLDEEYDQWAILNYENG